MAGSTSSRTACAAVAPEPERISLRSGAVIRMFHWGLGALLIAALLGVAGCTSRKEPRIEVREMLLVTPTGNHRLGPSDVGDRIQIQFPSLAVSMQAPGMRVTLAPFAQQPSVHVAPNQRDRSVRFESRGAFYQRDDEARIPLEGTQTELRLADGAWFASRWRMVLPAELSTIALTSSRPPPYMIRAIEAVEGETQRFHIPFSIDGERHVLDASIALETERSWSLASIGGLP